MKRILFYASAAALCIATSCKSTRQATIKDLSGEWNIISVNGASVDVSEYRNQPFIAFDTVNGRIFGNASCNSMMGQLNTSLPDGKIDLSGIASTRMACPDMNLEQKIFDAMSKVSEYKLTANNDIELRDDNGKTLLILKKREPSISAKDLNGKWSIRELDGENITTDNTDSSTVTFDTADYTFFCSTPCNNLSGKFQSGYTDISFGSIAQTEMACDDMSIEQKLTKVLPEIRSFGKLADGSIGFYNRQNDLLLILSK